MCLRCVPLAGAFAARSSLALRTLRRLSSGIFPEIAAPGFPPLPWLLKGRFRRLRLLARRGSASLVDGFFALGAVALRFLCMPWILVEISGGRLFPLCTLVNKPGLRFLRTRRIFTELWGCRLLIGRFTLRFPHMPRVFAGL